MLAMEVEHVFQCSVLKQRNFMKSKANYFGYIGRQHIAPFSSIGYCSYESVRLTVSHIHIKIVIMLCIVPFTRFTLRCFMEKLFLCKKNNIAIHSFLFIAVTDVSLII